MERNPYIKETDLIEKEGHFPVYAFFNIISESRFCDVVQDISNEIGRGEEFACCFFPEESDLPSEKFDGVEFSLQSGEEIVVDYKTFYRYLKTACERYLQNNPQDAGQIEEALKRVRSRYGITEE